MEILEEISKGHSIKTKNLPNGHVNFVARKCHQIEHLIQMQNIIFQNLTGFEYFDQQSIIILRNELEEMEKLLNEDEHQQQIIPHSDQIVENPRHDLKLEVHKKIKQIMASLPVNFGHFSQVSNKALFDGMHFSVQDVLDRAPILLVENCENKPKCLENESQIMINAFG